jgi:hypothetical protein
LLAVTLAIVLMVLISGRSIAAQARAAPVAELAAGVLLFPDDGVVTEGALGGNLRFYLSPRVSIGPEVTYVSGANHSHLMLTGNLTFDFRGPVNGEPPAVTPFLVAGGGLFRTRQRFFNNEVFASNEGAFTAGGGVRVRVGRSVFLGGEARVGWETHLRINALVGVQFGQ